MDPKRPLETYAQYRLSACFDHDKSPAKHSALLVDACFDGYNRGFRFNKNTETVVGGGTLEVEPGFITLRHFNGQAVVSAETSTAKCILLGDEFEKYPPEPGIPNEILGREDLPNYPGNIKDVRKSEKFKAYFDGNPQL
ncbi:MAG: hypothetical protein K9G62_07390 [Alphaproteobacteria bacterium]|nr:hypothetical protein [Alphaproteobacteria bacterium]